MKGVRTCAECVRLSHPISWAMDAIASGRLEADQRGRPSRRYSSPSPRSAAREDSLDCCCYSRVARRTRHELEARPGRGLQSVGRPHRFTGPRRSTAGLAVAGTVGGVSRDSIDGQGIVEQAPAPQSPRTGDQGATRLAEVIPYRAET